MNVLSWIKGNNIRTGYLPGIMEIAKQIFYTKLTYTKKYSLAITFHFNNEIFLLAFLLWTVSLRVCWDGPHFSFWNKRCISLRINSRFDYGLFSDLFNNINSRRLHLIFSVMTMCALQSCRNCALIISCYRGPATMYQALNNNCINDGALDN